jgi:pSer/pThr/pTyr-binding forkhead associated (FHA) protein
METGQRYPVLNEDLVIGRSSGDILFPGDEGLSHQHCRIVLDSRGLKIHDLGSHNGTQMNGHRLKAKKIYDFKTGSLIKVGNQEFKLHEPSIARRVRTGKRKRRSKSSSSDIASGIFVAACLAGAVALFIHWKRRSAELSPAVQTMRIVSPYELVEKDVRHAFDQYEQLGRERRDGVVGKKEFVEGLRRRLLPSFRMVQAKLGVVVPQNEFERRRLEVHRKLVSALIGQVKAMADHTQTNSKRSAKELEAYSRQVETLSQEAKALKRQPAQVW